MGPITREKSVHSNRPRNERGDRIIREGMQNSYYKYAQGLKVYMNTEKVNGLIKK